MHVVRIKVSKGAKIGNRYNQVPHLTQDTNGKVTNSQLDTTNESQEISSFPAGDHKAHINRRAQRHSLNQFHGANLTLDSDVDQDKFGKVTSHNTHDSKEVSPFPAVYHKSNILWRQTVCKNYQQTTLIDKV